ncbi:unnamed protein product [Prorocentrum cordatum]|uniref:Uncharacterized protein n=1 Tax=Prorocentrum cordatum TaxID=2364126 RepID=A0ABN9RVR8_9DINO|nr:unnamed protein product [Polarella glacialis]
MSCFCPTRGPGKSQLFPQERLVIRVCFSMHLAVWEGTFEEQLAAAGIRCVFPFPKGAGVTDWFDPATMASPQIPEDLVGIAHSMEQVDGEIDRLTTEEGYAAHPCFLPRASASSGTAPAGASPCTWRTGPAGTGASSGPWRARGASCRRAACASPPPPAPGGTALPAARPRPCS